MVQLCSHPVKAGSTPLPIQRFAPGYAGLALQRTRSSGYQADITFDADGFVTLCQDYLERVG